ncbi:MAG: SPOR domain-containing protein [Tangfeifania sp.]
MNRIVLLIIVVALAVGGCKSKKQMAQSEYTTDPANQSKVFTVPGTDTVPETEKEQETAKVEKEKTAESVEKPVAMRKEQVSFTNQEDKTENESNTYFVILGSFSQLDNAKNYREDLLNQGFTPIILHSETGYYRVCVDSYENELDARTRVAQIRRTYPKYSDVWLLIKD